MSREAAQVRALLRGDVRDAWLLAARDVRAARRLERVMSQLSEDRWSAGWLIDLEFILWRVVQEVRARPTNFWNGADPLVASWLPWRPEVEQLLALHEACGGWFATSDHFPEVAEEANSWSPLFVTTERWLRLYPALLGKSPL